LSTDAEDPRPKLPRFRAWVRRIVALAVWIVFVRYLRGLPPLPHPDLPLTIGAALLTVVASLYAFQSLWTFLPYVIAFPLWAPVYSLGSLVALLRVPVMGLSARLGRFYRSPIAAFLHIPLVLALEALIYSSRTRAYLTSALVVLLLATLDMVILTFFMSPSLLIARRILRLVRRYVDKGHLEATIYHRRFRAWPDPDTFEKAKDQAEFMFKAAGWIEKSTDTLLSPRAVVTSFLILLLITFFFVSLNFGFIYLAGTKLEAHFFGCTTTTPDIVDSTFFSLTYITTAGGSGLCAGTTLAKALVAIELFCGLTLLSVAGIGFATLHSTDVEGTREELSTILREAFERLRQIMTTLVEALRLAAAGKLPHEDAIKAEARESKKEEETVWAEQVRKAAKALPEDEISKAAAEMMGAFDDQSDTAEKAAQPVVEARPVLGRRNKRRSKR